MSYILSINTFYVVEHLQTKLVPGIADVITVVSQLFEVFKYKNAACHVTVQTAKCEDFPAEESLRELCTSKR